MKGNPTTRYILIELLAADRFAVDQISFFGSKQTNTYASEVLFLSREKVPNDRLSNSLWLEERKQEFNKIWLLSGEVQWRPPRWLQRLFFWIIPTVFTGIESFFNNTCKVSEIGIPETPFIV